VAAAGRLAWRYRRETLAQLWVGSAVGRLAEARRFDTPSVKRCAWVFVRQLITAGAEVAAHSAQLLPGGGGRRQPPPLRHPARRSRKPRSRSDPAGTRLAPGRACHPAAPPPRPTATSAASPNTPSSTSWSPTTSRRSSSTPARATTAAYPPTSSRSSASTCDAESCPSASCAHTARPAGAVC